MRNLMLSLAAGAAALAVAPPAAAQENAGDRVNVVIVYGDDACPESTEEEIVVCPRLDEAERYRIPPDLRGDPNDLDNEAWTQRVKSYETVGASGTNSCSPVGAGGFTGCTQELVQQAYAERGQASSVQAGLLIEEARQERLARIDAEAAETERLVQEELARREERERRQAAIEAGLDPDALDDEELPDPEAVTEAPPVTPDNPEQD